MGEIINMNTAIETQPGGDTGALLDITQSLLADARTALNSSGVLSVPIAELSTLGAGVSSLIPALNTVTQTTSIAADGLYTIANAGVGDVLKAAKNGNFWASLKNCGKEHLKWFSCKKLGQLPLPHRQRQHSIPPL